MPDLEFAVLDAGTLPYAASPTLLLRLQIGNRHADEQIQAVSLRVQIRIETARRHYDTASEARLLELFGPPARCGETLRSLLWAHAALDVPRFSSSVVVDLPVTCTYDFEVASAKYFAALDDGEVPLLLLFSGTIFYSPSREEGLRIMQIPWEKETRYRLPVRVWRETMDRYFPNSAWIRIRKDVFDLLCAYKARQAQPTWEDALAQLLQ